MQVLHSQEQYKPSADINPHLKLYAKIKDQNIKKVRIKVIKIKYDYRNLLQKICRQ